MQIPPYIYEPAKSFEVAEQTTAYINAHPLVKRKLEQLGWIYHCISNIIPQIEQNFWSGHSFPYAESWEELQVGCTQCFLGLYKQAFMSLRSGLELGLLSVYYNINDEGHQTVQTWLQSSDSPDAKTPKSDKIWKVLLSHKTIQTFNNSLDLRTKFNELSYLHNYVHTKGVRYSNSINNKKGNSQQFLPAVLLEWMEAYEQVVVLVITLHLLKYPHAIVGFDFTHKFGIHRPNFGALSNNEVDQISTILPPNYLAEIRRIAAADPLTQEIISEVQSLPHLTDDQIEAQVLEQEKIYIRHGQGFDHWEKQQLEFMKSLESNDPNLLDIQSKNTLLNRISILRNWARDNGLLESPSEI